MQGIQLAQQTNKCNNKKQGQWNFTDRFDIRRKKKPGNIYYALKALLCGIMYVKGFSPRPLPYFFLAGSMNVRIFFTTLLAITRLLDFWVHYPTLPYPKLKNHYPSGPAREEETVAIKHLFQQLSIALVKSDATSINNHNPGAVFERDEGIG